MTRQIAGHVQKFQSRIDGFNLNVKHPCMILAYHIRPDFAKLPEVFFSFGAYIKQMFNVVILFDLSVI